jgi:hypothetical protein
MDTNCFSLKGFRNVMQKAGQRGPPSLTSFLHERTQSEEFQEVRSIHII